ncbi:MAG: transcriptional regulator [Pseudomonadales bacterium]|nr:transcriptional regulator [Pseudomonadales bacterium]
MNNLPFLIDADEAIEYYNGQKELTDAEKAYVVSILYKEGYSNKKIREALGIRKVYTVTHLKRAGTHLSESELELWHKNPTRITLGHVRAIAKLPQPKREELIRNLLTIRTPVHKFEAIAQGKPEYADADIKRYEQIMGEVLGRQIKIRFNAVKRTGSITLDFFGLDDLDDISKSMGFKAEEHI